MDPFLSITGDVDGVHTSQKARTTTEVVCVFEESLASVMVNVMLYEASVTSESVRPLVLNVVEASVVTSYF